MNGYEITSESGNLLILEPVSGSVFLLLFTLIGLIGIVLFILIRMNVMQNVPVNLHYVLLGFGIVFFSGGLIFLFGNSPHRIVMDKEKKSVTFYEKYLWESEQETVIPFAQIDSIKITTPYFADMSGVKQENRSYILYFIFKDSSMLGLQESETIAPLEENGIKIAEFLNMQHAPNNVVYAASAVNELKNHISEESNFARISHLTSQNEDIYSWTHSRSFIHSGLLFLVIIGFNIIIFKVPFRSMINKFLAVIVILAINVALTIVVAFSVFGEQILALAPDALILENKVLGYGISGKKLNKSDIALIQTGLADHYDGMILMTVNAKMYMDQMTQWAVARDTKEPGLEDMMAMARTAMAFQKEIMQIDGRALSFRDRYYLKQQIQIWLNKPSKFMR